MEPLKMNETRVTASTPLQFGDVVKFWLGGPSMLVTNVNNNATDGHKYVRCVWFNSVGDYNQADFYRTSLVKIG